MQFCWRKGKLMELEVVRLRVWASCGALEFVEQALDGDAISDNISSSHNPTEQLSERC